MTDILEYLVTLGLNDDDLVGMFWKNLATEEQHVMVTPVVTVPSVVDSIETAYDIYLAPNPTAGPPRYDKGRGKETDVTRVVAVYADLDIKPGACPDMDAANGIIAEVENVLGTPTVATVFSGGGLQPIWTLEDCDPETGRKLLRRFGRLVKRIAADRGITVDSVFDTARVLRVPGTFNHKYGEPVETALIPGSGAAMTPAELDERLAEVGIWELNDEDLLGSEVIEYPESAPWADKTCGYMTKVMEQWRTEPVADRHPWLLGQYVRLECARRYSCFTEADYRRGIDVLTRRFERECARPGDTRRVKRMEISDIADEARSRASRKTDAQLRIELGADDGKGHVHSLDSLIGIISTENLVAPSGVLNPVAAVEDTPPPEIFPGLIAAEDNFWDSRESLKEIYDFALSRMCSPWAVLGACAAMALAWVRPNAQLENIGFGLGSLNTFTAIAAGSGQGKSTALRAAEQLLPANVQPFSVSVGSGEGMLEAFVMRDPNDDKKIGVRESLLVQIDEVDLLLAMKARQGSSLLGLMKSAFTGEKLSLTYANRKYPVLKRDSYRLSILCAVQPGKAGWMFEDLKGGFPQRFMWFPGNDARISRSLYQQAAYTMGLVLPEADEFRTPREILIPAEARDFIHDTREAAGQGNDDAGLDSHAAFARLKFAYALTVLDGRAMMSLEDWQLAGVASKVSGLTRDWVLRGIRSERERDATERGEYQGTMRAVSEEARDAFSAQRAEAVMAKVLAMIREAMPEGLPDRELRKRFAHRDRGYVTVATTKLAEDGLIKSATSGPKGGAAWFI